MFSHSALRKDAFNLLRHARVPLPLYAGLLLLINCVLSLADTLSSGPTFEKAIQSDGFFFHSSVSGVLSPGMPGVFIYILTGLISVLLEMGRVEYCARVRRGEQAEYGDLFWGFSYVFRVLSVVFLQAFIIAFGLSFFLLPGLILSYRYRFSLFILHEDPTLSPFEVLRRSREETMGFKMELFSLDLSFIGWSILSALPLALWEMTALTTKLGVAASLCVSSLLTFPVLLVTFWRTTVEMDLRDKILHITSNPIQF